MNTEQIRAKVTNARLRGDSYLPYITCDELEALVQERDALRLVERGMEMTINDLKESRDTYQREADKLAAENKVLRDALEEVMKWAAPGSHSKKVARAALGEVK